MHLWQLLTSPAALRPTSCNLCADFIVSSRLSCANQPVDWNKPPECPIFIFIFKRINKRDVRILMPSTWKLGGIWNVQASLSLLQFLNESIPEWPPLGTNWTYSKQLQTAFLLKSRDQSSTSHNFFFFLNASFEKSILFEITYRINEVHHYWHA